ncbi:alpha/beta fold hydrolase [Hymenobacter sp. HMF4947]|uniref:Alpha/beta fold hydrolase n=1 Tax=Hymenobacter ginkgonis TaxID=2682976 RepID=A0A7K1T9J5_9BACT|nr:alpha/beta hydrolase [Hymenobacter ginkgonis]MVN75068.1 alpha/beta fold hydrolase [Hymenobacter ginkgonis]
MRFILLIGLWLWAVASLAQPVRPHYVRVADSQLYVEESGHGPVLLLLHGGLLDHRQWAPQVRAWSRHFRVLNCDMRKHGLTHDGDSTVLSSDALATVLDSLHAPTAYVLGHSLGSVAALDLALAYPQRVRRLVLAAPGLIGYDLNHDSVLVANSRLEDAARQRHDTLSYIEYFVRSWVDGPHRQPAQTPPALRARATQLVRQNLTRHQWATHLKFSYEPTPRQRLAEVQAPTLVLVGSLDMQDILTISQELGQRLPHVRRVVLPGAAHLLNLEQPQRFTREVQAFLLEKEK